jgi:hypothetical protein
VAELNTVKPPKEWRGASVASPCFTVSCPLLITISQIGGTVDSVIERRPFRILSGCGDQQVESNGSVDYLVLFATGTTEERILEIVRLTESTILEYSQSGFSLEYKIHVPVSHGLVEDGALFHRFPEVEAVTRAVVGHFY